MSEADVQPLLIRPKRQDADQQRDQRLTPRQTHPQAPLLAEHWLHPKSQPDHFWQRHLHPKEEVSRFEKTEDSYTHLQEKEAHQYIHVFVAETIKPADYSQLPPDHHEARRQSLESLLVEVRENVVRGTIEVA